MANLTSSAFDEFSDRRCPESRLTIVNNIYISGVPQPTGIRSQPVVQNGVKPACPDSWTFFSAAVKCYKVRSAAESKTVGLRFLTADDIGLSLGSLVSAPRREENSMKAENIFEVV